MSKEALFFIYLIERYADYKNSSANKVLSQWDQLNITQIINDMYERYHCERLENAFIDIDSMIAQKLEKLK